MKFAIVHDTLDSEGRKAIKRVTKTIKTGGARVITGDGKFRADMVISIGSSSNILKTFRELDGIDVPVLGVSPYKGEFLSELTLEQFESVFHKILENDYSVDERSRIFAVVGGKPTPPILNDLVITSSKSASIMSYSVVVGGKKITSDTGDGIIVATPNGSTGYSASAGGPIVSSDSRVVVLTPVSSMKQTKPMVFGENSVITIKDLNSSSGVELISDGRFRSKFKGTEIIIKKYEKPAKFVVFEEFSKSSVEKLRNRQISRVEDIDKAPPSAKFIIKLLEYEGPMTQKDIIRLSSLQPRTVRHGLMYLRNKKIIDEQRSLRDARYSIYRLR